jgi:hypothetical protein
MLFEGQACIRTVLATREHIDECISRWVGHSSYTRHVLDVGLGRTTMWECRLEKVDTMAAALSQLRPIGHLGLVVVDRPSRWLGNMRCIVHYLVDWRQVPCRVHRQVVLFAG